MFWNNAVDHFHIVQGRNWILWHCYAFEKIDKKRKVEHFIRRLINDYWDLVSPRPMKHCWMACWRNRLYENHFLMINKCSDTAHALNIFKDTITKMSHWHSENFLSEISETRLSCTILTSSNVQIHCKLQQSNLDICHERWLLMYCVNCTREWLEGGLNNNFVFLCLFLHKVLEIISDLVFSRWFSAIRSWLAARNPFSHLNEN